jgi:hypothetical protein
MRPVERPDAEMDDAGFKSRPVIGGATNTGGQISEGGVGQAHNAFYP